MSKKILITGGAGFIGSHLCDRLVERGDEVIILDDLSSGHMHNLVKSQDKVRFIEGSVLDLATHRDALVGIDHIFHLAALISGYDSLKAPDEYIDLNLKGLMRVIELARDEGARISFASSSTVYGNSSKDERSESDAPAPLTMYALSKLAGEHMLEMYRQLYGVEYVALRFFNVYGQRQSPTHAYANVTCKFSQAAALGTGIKLYGDGSQTRDFVHVDDVVASLLVTMDGAPGRLYNVGTGEDHAILGLVETLEGISGRPFEIERCDPWPNDIRKIIADVSLLTSQTAWRPRVSLAEGLAQTVRYFEGVARGEWT
jgi:UDP-glucose 4-epimerase